MSGALCDWRASVVRVAPGQEGSATCLLLQPCMMATGTALTDALRRDGTRVFLPNPYVCRIRLVECPAP